MFLCPLSGQNVDVLENISINKSKFGKLGIFGIYSNSGYTNLKRPDKAIQKKRQISKKKWRANKFMWLSLLILYETTRYIQ